MKYFLLFFLTLPVAMKAQDSPFVYSLQSKANAIVEVKGNLQEGGVIDDLSWAWSSSNACFPATQSRKFSGNHVLYITQLPSYSEMEVTVIPSNPLVNLSVYAYQVGMGSDVPIVPNLPSCVRCEVDHLWDRAYRGKSQDHTRTVRDLVAIRNPYQVIIGVVGANGLEEADYTLKVKLKTRE